MTGKKTVLIILDGWGHGNKNKSDAIHCANTPFIDSLYKSSPNCELKTFGDMLDFQLDKWEIPRLGT